VAERYKYTAYGKVTIYEADNITVKQNSTIGNRFMFTGREYDEETGLYYYRARYYSTSMGRFLSTDPAKDDNLLNQYTYVFNQPTTFTDAFGLSVKFDVKWFYGVAESNRAGGQLGYDAPERESTWDFVPGRTKPMHVSKTKAPVFDARKEVITTAKDCQVSSWFGWCKEGPEFTVKINVYIANPTDEKYKTKNSMTKTELGEKLIQAVWFHESGHLIATMAVARALFGKLEQDVENLKGRDNTEEKVKRKLKEESDKILTNNYATALNEYKKEWGKMGTIWERMSQGEEDPDKVYEKFLEYNKLDINRWRKRAGLK
jgi:RHS repeat-associated protein